MHAKRIDGPERAGSSRCRWGRPSPALVLTSMLAAACGSESTSPVVDSGSPPFVVPAEITARLREEVIPFDGSHLVLPHDDLEPLREIVGHARVVALGENTHGTRDFFEMKARILRFLVEEMGFDAFAIEATWPEANRLNRYVRTGEGDSLISVTLQPDKETLTDQDLDDLSAEIVAAVAKATGGVLRA